MNEFGNNCEKLKFKNWVKKRFINSLDFYSISPQNILNWAEALRELSDELIDTLKKNGFYHHQIVPFTKGKK